MEQLSVWFQGFRAGALDYDDRTNSFTFSYDPDYLTRDDAAALSVSLPLREAAYDPYVSRKFFENLLDLEPEQKYQEEGGPSVARCLRAIRDLRLGFAGQKKFLDYVIFNCLIGNADAHGKNFSILYRNAIPEVAPLYDAMSTSIYEGATTHMAMRIGSAVSLADVSRTSFAELAKACDVNTKLVLDELDRLSGSILPAAKRLEECLSDEGLPSSVYARIVKVLSVQCDAVGRSC